MLDEKKLGQEENQRTNKNKTCGLKWDPRLLTLKKTKLIIN